MKSIVANAIVKLFHVPVSFLSLTPNSSYQLRLLCLSYLPISIQFLHHCFLSSLNLTRNPQLPSMQSHTDCTDCAFVSATSVRPSHCCWGQAIGIDNGHIIQCGFFSTSDTCRNVACILGVSQFGDYHQVSLTGVPFRVTEEVWFTVLLSSGPSQCVFTFVLQNLLFLSPFF